MTQIVTLMALSLHTWSTATHSGSNLRVHDNNCVKYSFVYRYLFFDTLLGLYFFGYTAFKLSHTKVNLRKIDKITPCASANAIGGSIDHISIEYSASKGIGGVTGCNFIFLSTDKILAIVHPHWMILEYNREG